MRLEDQVVSLELAQRLKELGVKQKDVYAHWFLLAGAPNEPQRACLICQDISLRYIQTNTGFAAFTVAELGEMLPVYSGSIRRQDDFFCSNFTGNRWHPNDEESQRAVTEADARAKMLIYLIEKGMVKP